MKTLPSEVLVKWNEPERDAPFLEVGIELEDVVAGMNVGESCVVGCYTLTGQRRVKVTVTDMPTPKTTKK